MSGESIGTEHGFAITFGTTGCTYRLTNVAGHKETGDVVETTHHGTTGKRTYMPGDLVGLDSFDVTFQHEGKVAVPAALTRETITITRPLGYGETTASKVVGEGFIKDRQFPGGQAGGTGLRTVTLTIQWTGETGPTETAGS